MQVQRSFVPRNEKTNVVYNRCNTNRSVQAQKMAGGWKFWFRKKKFVLLSGVVMVR